MKKVALFGRKFTKKSYEYAKDIIYLLDQRNIELTIFEDFKEFLSQQKIIGKDYATFNNQSGLEEVDAVISLGGDGTLLEAVTHIQHKEIPILGINAGRLGFMAATPIEKGVASVESLLDGKYIIEDRNLVCCKTDNDVFGELNFGLNELAIQKRDTSSMIVIHAYLNGEFLNSYWADGLIVATPTGSTGYSLSCGGPLLMPITNNFILAPVNPHNLNVRPLIVPDSSELTFELEGRSNKVLLSLDSRSISAPIKTTITVSKADFICKLVQVEGYNYFNTLRSKLNWGYDIRN